MDEDTTNPETEVETPEEELEEELDTETETELDDDGNPIEEPDDEDEDSVEVEYEGQKYKVPVALKDGILRQADYTRKTQEVAELRKEAEATLQQATQVSQQERTIETQLTVNAEAIEVYKTIDWQKWVQQDPVAANSARMEYQDLIMQQQTLTASHTEAQNQRLALQQQETAKRLAEGQKVLAENIPGWGQDKANAILQFGQTTYGLTDKELREIDDPRAIMILHDAMEARKVKQTAATKQKVEKQQAIKPAVVVKGGGKTIKGLDDRLSAEEWVRRRNAQVAKRK